MLHDVDITRKATAVNVRSLANQVTENSISKMSLVFRGRTSMEAHRSVGLGLSWCEVEKKRAPLLVHLMYHDLQQSD